MTSLKKAKKEGKLDEFIKEHEGDEPSERERFDRTLDHMVRKGKPKAARGASARGKSDG